MFAQLLRVSAIFATPLALASLAHADVRDAQPYGVDEGPAAIMLFSGEGFSGETREIFDPIAALPDLRFNDRTRSIAILAGQWEVCDDSDFTGHCVFLRGDVERMDWYGLDRRISSVRPIYEYTDAEHGLMFTRDRNGYIRYADNQRYDTDYGYSGDTRIIVEHYGYSPDYRTRGYYDPRSSYGYGPYGFGYGYYDTYGNRGYAYRPNRVHRPQRTHYGARNGAITLYEHSNARGLSLGLNDSVPDLRRYRLNNNLSSVGVTSGRWEVCDQANYQGNCTIIDAPNGFLNLSRGLNDRASSIRRIDDGPRPVGRRGGHDRDGGVHRRGRLDRVNGGSELSGGTVVAPSPRTARRDTPRVRRDVADPRRDITTAPTPVVQPDRRRGNDGVRRGIDRDVSPAPVRRPDRRRDTSDGVGRRGNIGRAVSPPSSPRAVAPVQPVAQPRAPAPRRTQAPRPQPQPRIQAPQPRPQPQARPQRSAPSPRQGHRNQNGPDRVLD